MTISPNETIIHTFQPFSVDINCPECGAHELVSVSIPMHCNNSCDKCGNIYLLDVALKPVVTVVKTC